MDDIEMRSLRHQIHADPEVGLDLPRTQRAILGALDGLGLEITTGTALSSVVAVLRGASSEQSVLLRADMDALPVRELTDLPFKASGNRMHACGHDLHIAMLVRAAHLLAARRDTLNGNVIFMFQPGEEGHGGAASMIDEGLLTAAGRPPIAAYAVHVISSQLPLGIFATRPGPLLAAADTLSITVHGSGGHGSTPHLARDPVVAAAAMVVELEVMLTREFDVFDPVVLTVGSLHGGTAHNVIPASAHLEATLRSFTSRSRERLIHVATRVCQGIGAAHGMDVTVEVSDVFPLTTNDESEARHSATTASNLFGSHRVQTLGHPFMGSEDFSLVLERIPGAMTFIGACPEGLDPGVAAYNHSPKALFDDAVLPDGAAFLANLAFSRLAETRQQEASVAQPESPLTSQP